MRVLHVLTRDHRRGAEAFGMQLHEALLTRGEQSQVVALAPGPADQVGFGLPVLGASPRGLGTLRALRRSAASVDVVVAHGSDTLLACRLALLGAATPFVYVNIGDPLHWSGTTLRRLRVTWMLRGAAAVGAIAPSAVERLVDHLKVPRARVRFTGNGRDPQHFRPATAEQRTAARQALGLPPDAPVVVSVAALATEKRLDVAVDAVASLPGWHLLLVGGGLLDAALRGQGERSAPGRVHLTGVLTDVRPAFRAADVALLTSTTEGLPGALVEAALSGLPIVATDVGFVCDVVIDGRTGRLVPVDDVPATAEALGACLERAADYGPRGRSVAIGRFDGQSVTQRWSELLLAVHERRSGRAE